jgi:phage/plasmid-like protein (TIGR03299 family)
MSHELETHGDKAAFFSAREDAWHKLGTVTAGALTAEEALKTAYLAGWNVRKAPLFAPVDLGGDAGVVNLSVPNQYAVIRDNPFTGKVESIGADDGKGAVVGKTHVTIQNEDHAAFLNALSDESGAHIETAGSLRGGRQVFITMKLPDTMQIGGADAVDTYIVATNSHDGTSSFQTMTTPIRVVCANTLAAAVKDADRIHKIRHTAKGLTAVQQAREVLGLTFKFNAAFEAEAEKMIQRSYTERQFVNLMDKLMGKVDLEKPEGYRRPLETARESLMWSFADSPTNENIRGTRWAAYQAFTEYTDHLLQMTGENVEERRAAAVVNGHADKLKLAAWGALAAA